MPSFLDSNVETSVEFFFLVWFVITSFNYDDFSLTDIWYGFKK